METQAIVDAINGLRTTISICFLGLVVELFGIALILYGVWKK